jgi:DNA-binding NarL/FixJ family response regulator
MWSRSSDAKLTQVALTCLIVDDSARFLDIATSLLQRHGVEVVGTANSAEEARSRAAELRPDVVLVDIDLGGESGFELTRDLARTEHARVILISTHAEVDFADLIDASPALGFIPKAELSASALHDLLDGAEGNGRPEG